MTQLYIKYTYITQRLLEGEKYEAQITINEFINICTRIHGTTNTERILSKIFQKRNDLQYQKFKFKEFFNEEIKK